VGAARARVRARRSCATWESNFPAWSGILTRLTKGHWTAVNRVSHTWCRSSLTWCSSSKSTYRSSATGRILKVLPKPCRHSLNLCGNFSTTCGGTAIRGTGDRGRILERGLLQGRKPQDQAIQGRRPQGQAIQGRRPQGQAIQGRRPQGQAIQGRRPQDQAIQGRRPQGQAIQGRRPQGQAIQGRRPQDQAIQGRRRQGRRRQGQAIRGTPVSRILHSRVTGSITMGTGMVMGMGTVMGMGLGTDLGTDMGPGTTCLGHMTRSHTSGRWRTAEGIGGTRDLESCLLVRSMKCQAAGWPVRAP
jgi:hypothetical protein